MHQNDAAVQVEYDEERKGEKIEESASRLLIIDQYMMSVTGGGGE